MKQAETNRLESGPTFLDSKTGRFLVIMSFWTGIAIVTAVLSHLRMVSLEQPSIFYRWLADSLLAWYGWAALTPLIFRLGRTYLPIGQRLTGHVLILVVAGALLTAIQISYQCFASMMVMGEPLEKYPSVVTAQLVWLGPWNFLVYAGILGAGYAREFRLRWRERQMVAGKLEVELARAQVAALRAQIQPHFFFNTLNSISVLIEKGEAAKAQEMLSRLGDLLRFSFSVGNRQMIPLRDEIGFVSGYLEIEKLRFGQRLRVQMNIDPAAQDLDIPPFLLQPLAENSIRHGLATKAGDGTLMLRARLDSDQLIIEVEDDGVGMDKSSANSGSGVGLTNIRSRLERLYGDDFQFQIGPRNGGGTMVSLRIPVDTDDQTR